MSAYDLWPDQVCKVCDYPFADDKACDNPCCWNNPKLSADRVRRIHAANAAYEADKLAREERMRMLELSLRPNR